MSFDLVPSFRRAILYSRLAIAPWNIYNIQKYYWVYVVVEGSRIDVWTLFKGPDARNFIFDCIWSINFLVVLPAQYSELAAAWSQYTIPNHLLKLASAWIQTILLTRHPDTLVSQSQTILLTQFLEILVLACLAWRPKKHLGLILLAFITGMLSRCPDKIWLQGLITWIIKILWT